MNNGYYPVHRPAIDKELRPWSRVGGPLYLAMSQSVVVIGLVGFAVWTLLKRMCLQRTEFVVSSARGRYSDTFRGCRIRLWPPMGEDSC